MLIYVLAFSVIITGLFLYFTYYIAPRFNPINKAEQYLKDNMVFEAILEYKKAIDRNPDDFVVHSKLATIYLKQKEIDQAVIHLEKIIEINQFNYEVDKLEIAKKLAQSYQFRDEFEKSFKTYLNILKDYPVDQDALYNVAFLALGQEEFEIAQRFLERLVKQIPNDFDALFGAGICSYQNQRIGDSANYFKSAVNVRPDSDIANLAAAFSFLRKSDFRQALIYAQKLTEGERDSAIIFVAKRLSGFLLIHLKKYDDAVKVFEEIIALTKKNDLSEELLITLYDIGFACIKAERTSQAYDYWNELYRNDKNFKSVQTVVTILRKEMEIDYKYIKTESELNMDEFIEHWMDDIFPDDFLWNICGLKSDIKIDIRNMMTTTHIATGQNETPEHVFERGTNYDNLEKFIHVNNETFRIVSGKLVVKLGLKVDQFLQTYRENDGLDLSAISPGKEKILVWIRRWSKNKVGEIPLRNFAQAINDFKANKGYFITSSELTPSAENSLSGLSKVTVVASDELANLLEGLL